MALANFNEMRDHVASPLFRIKKRGEKALHTLFPRWFIPLYTMISFTRIPYAEAKARAERQSLIVRGAAIILGLLVLGALAWRLG